MLSSFGVSRKASHPNRRLQRGGLPVSPPFIAFRRRRGIVTVALTGNYLLRLTPDTLPSAVWTFLSGATPDQPLCFPDCHNYTLVDKQFVLPQTLVHYYTRGEVIILDILTIWQQALLSAWTDLITRLLLFLPVLLSAILVFAVGLLLADWISQAVDKLLRLVRLSHLTKNAGLDGFLRKADIGYDTTGLITISSKWLIVLIFFMAAVNILGLSAITSVLNSLISYLPRVFSAAVIIGVGAFFARLAEGLVKSALASVDHGHAKPLSHLARWLVMIVAILAGVNELKIAQNLVETFFQGLTWTVTLAVGLAVGLGAKDTVAQVLRDWVEKLKA